MVRLAATLALILIAAGCSRSERATFSDTPAPAPEPRVAAVTLAQSNIDPTALAKTLFGA